MTAQDNPKIDQIEELIDFCNTHEKLYIFNHKKNQRLIKKFLTQSGIKVDGYVVMNENDIKPANLPVYMINQIDDSNAGIIISNEDGKYNLIYNALKNNNLTNLYFVSEWNKRTIPFKMTPRKKENFVFEVNLVDHCNLNCQCCDHFSPVAEKFFIDIHELENDLKRLAVLTDGYIGGLKLEGGEPTLHPQCIQILKMARNCFPESRIDLFSNGISLLSLEKSKNGNLWQAIKDNDITLMVTTYPIDVDYDAIDNKAKEYGIKYDRFYEIGDGDNRVNIIKHSVHHPFDLSAKVPRSEYVSCYHFNECITLRHGKIYTCPIIPYSEHFNKYFNQDLKHLEENGIDIYKAESFEEIAEFCTHRVSFCNYCNIKGRNVRDYRHSKNEITEWV